jgi:AcrR family transcriptional regulator
MGCAKKAAMTEPRAPRRNDARSEDRRAAIIDRLADHVLAHGVEASSLRPLAAAAGLSDRMLLYYFKDKAEVMTAAINQTSARMVGLLAAKTGTDPLPLAELHAKLVAVLFDDAIWPYQRMWMEIVAKAAQGDAFYKAVGESMGRGFLAWGAAQLDSPTPEARAADAAKLMVMLEGMVLLRSIGMEDVCRQALQR